MSGPKKAAEIRSEPFNRLTRMCNDVTKFLEGHPDYLPGDQAIIIIEDEGDVGSVLFNHTDISSPVSTLLQMLGNLCRAAGKKMQVQLGEDGEVMDL